MIKKVWEIWAHFSNCGKHCDKSCPQLDGDLCGLPQDNGGRFAQVEYNEKTSEFARCETCIDMFGEK